MLFSATNRRLLHQSRLRSHGLRLLSSKNDDHKVPAASDGEVKPRAFAPPMPKGDSVSHRTSSQTYIPKEKHQRVSFEYPDAPSERDDMKPISRWRPVMPIGLALLAGVWGLYAYNYFTDDIPNEYLHPNKFIPFVITNKVDIDKDHYLIELKPKYYRWRKENPEIWNGSKLWNVEVKQPQIMVVRQYTPLPLEIYESSDGNPIVRVRSEEDKEGKMVLYIKKYDQGEVARWIYKKPVGSELELRGPFIDFEFPKTINNNFERPHFANLPSSVPADPKFPMTPDSIVFFAAGTGIAPVLQTLLSHNPYRGFIDVLYSHKTEEEVPFKNFLYFLEKLDRAKFHHFVQEKGHMLTPKDVPSPVKSNLVDFEASLGSKKTDVGLPTFKTALEQAQHSKKEPKQGPSLAIVCGPDGYLSYVCGLKPYQGQGQLTGLLKEKGWNEDNVFKM